MRLIGWIMLLSAFTVGLKAQSYTVESVPNPQKNIRPGFVSDPDDLLAAETERIVNAKIDSLRHLNGTEVAVVAVNSIDDADPNDFANRLYNYWGIGQKERNNGVLLLVVTDMREVVIRTGYGVEGVLPDFTASRIISEIIIPEFRANGYDTGIITAVDVICQIIAGEEFTIEEHHENEHWSEVVPYAIAIYLLLMLMGWLLLSLLIRKTVRNSKLTTNITRYTSIKKKNSTLYFLTGFIFPTIFYFFELLSADHAPLLLFSPLAAFPVFLYGKRTMNRVRRMPIPCQACGGQMQMLEEQEDDERLKKSQQLEEKLYSVDYDVFVCPHCNNEAVFALEFTGRYKRCPSCKTKAYSQVSRETLLAPTYKSTGRERVVHMCKYCGYEKAMEITMPRLTRSSSSGGGFGGGSSGGGGGFGGGSSGGGGASGKW